MTAEALIESIVLGLILVGCVVYMFNRARRLFGKQSEGGCSCSANPEGCDNVITPGKQHQRSDSGAVSHPRIPAENI